MRGLAVVDGEVSYPGNSENPIWSKVVLAIIIVLLSVGCVYLAYVLFIKDCILLLKAKRSRTTQEFGFGNTPARTNGGGVGPAGGIV